MKSIEMDKGVINLLNELFCIDVNTTLDNGLMDNYLKNIDILNNTEKINVVENSDDYNLELNFAGYEKKDFKIEFEKGKLKLIAEIKNETKWKKSFEKTIYVGNDVDAEKIQAEYKNGILKMVLPKLEASKSKSIKIA